MKTYQFTCAVRITETGELMPIQGLVTPPVNCNTPSEAIKCLETTAFCEMNKCTVYRMVT